MSTFLVLKRFANLTEGTDSLRLIGAILVECGITPFSRVRRKAIARL